MNESIHKNFYKVIPTYVKICELCYYKDFVVNYLFKIASIQEHATRENKVCGDFNAKYYTITDAWKRPKPIYIRDEKSKNDYHFNFEYKTLK